MSWLSRESNAAGLPSAGHAARADTDVEATASVQSPLLTETVEYRSARKIEGAEEFPERSARYRLVRKLGAGGMGTVFEAVDETHSQRVAVKLIGRDYVSSSEAVERFRQEGKLASAVTHPRCVFVLAVDEYQGAPYIVMELMPGTTLHNLVQKDGPLEPPEAIAKIFDVIEGLQQFHKRGLIHRDVKPSNCFLESDGRVKIGDFGLSKSLQGGADLTRTGTFLGTPLYASPEQIKRDEVDERTDVYSVAATLYYLLSGHAPVQAKDAAEALARIASEPAPPLRSFRPEIPRALESVIHRGLERDPARRWRNLQELHDALLPFVPERLPIAGIGLRFGAYFVDMALWYLVSWAIFAVVMLYHQGQLMATLRFQQQNDNVLDWFERIIWLAYFLLLEGIGGASLGKWLMGLRVNRADGGGPPGLARGLARALAFYAITELPSDIVGWLLSPTRNPERFPSSGFLDFKFYLRFWFYEALARGLGLLALTVTMRKATGFRGPHEWLSGTRVFRVGALQRYLPTYRLQALAGSRISPQESPAHPRLLAAVGPYVIQSTIRWGTRQKIVLGQDSQLGRPVWIVVREPEAEPPSPARRSLSRQSRPRWSGGGDCADGRWDAYTAPTGVPLSELVTSEGLPWSDALPVIRQLAAELQAARDDQTLPCRLAIEQVWVEPDGGVQLIDFLEGPESSTSVTVPVSDAAPPASDLSLSSTEISAAPDGARRLLAFLGDVARLALEGTRHATRSGIRSQGRNRALPDWFPTSWGRRIRAAVPERAGVILERLTGVRRPFESLEAVLDVLDTAASRPTTISVVRRGIHLGIQMFFLLPGILLMFLISSAFTPPGLFPWDLAMIASIPMCWVLWAMVSRGGLSLPLAGITLVRKDGRRASRLACGWRTFLVWVLPTALLMASRSIRETAPRAHDLAAGLWFATALLLLGFVALALVLRSRGPHDRLAGTLLVPL